MENRYLTNSDKNLPSSEQDKWFVYGIECDDGSVYIGQTEDILKRWKLHKKGEAAQWTTKHTPIRLFYYEIVGSFKEAFHREKDLKTTRGRRLLKELLKIGSQAGEPAEKLLERILNQRK